MLTLKSLVKYLNEFLNTPIIQDYCPNGLQIEGKESISKIATGVTADIETIEKTIASGAQALIVHHGLFWNKDSLIIEGSKRKKIKLLLENEISLLAYHLPLDAHQLVGNNWKAAQDLQWKELAPFYKINGCSIGVKGRVEPQSLEEFTFKLESYYQHTAVYVPAGKKTVSSCALISGGAWREVKEAAQEGIDCFITGSFDEPAWAIAKEEHINFFALGHTATEKIGVKALGKYLEEKFNVHWEFIETTNLF